MLLAAILIELIGIATVAAGIGLEIAYGGSVHLVTITVGSCLVAIGGVLFGKFFRMKK